jgi:hypothetical protein
MCQECYIENGSPRIDNEKTQKAADLIDAVYSLPNGGAGGYAHIVLDDWNLDDSSIDLCIEAAKEGKYDLGEEVQKASLECMQFMKELTMEERASAMAITSGYM